MLLYYITDRSQFAGDEAGRRRSLLAKIAEAAACGVDYIQLREKDLPTRELESLAREAAEVMARIESKVHRSALLINSRTDVALTCGADGVHLRGDDISPRDVRKTWAQNAVTSGPRAVRTGATPPIIAVSCHSLTDVHRAAEEGADFAVFGPVFEKAGSDPHPAGLQILARACKEEIPVLALGGITLQNAMFCLEAGAAGIAGIRLFQRNNVADIVAAVRSAGTRGLPKAT